MDLLSCEKHTLTTLAPSTDNTEGISTKHWYVAVVNHNSERKCESILREKGYETYVPVQEITRINSRGKRHQVSHVVISSVVFLHSTERQRREVVRLPFITRFMTNRAGLTDDFNRHPLAVVPNEQMERLKFMLYQAESPVSIESRPLQIGDKIRVIRGRLQGLEGNVIRTPEGEAYLIVLLDLIGCAKVQISLSDVEIID